WKKVKTKHRNLTKLGIKPNKAWEWANSRLGYWSVSKSPILDRTLDNQYWTNQGLKSLLIRYQTLRLT
ncbi:hypothetical protein BIV59_22595, partial [Bacillus sp. MUM 13]